MGLAVQQGSTGGVLFGYSYYWMIVLALLPLNSLSYGMESGTGNRETNMVTDHVAPTCLKNF